MNEQMLFINGVCVGATPTGCNMGTEPAEPVEPDKTPKYTKSLSLKVRISLEDKKRLEDETADVFWLGLLLYSCVYAEEKYQEAEWIETWHRWALNNCLKRKTARKIFDSYTLYPKKRKQ